MTDQELICMHMRGLKAAPEHMVVPSGYRRRSILRRIISGRPPGSPPAKP